MSNDGTQVDQISMSNRTYGKATYGRQISFHTYILDIRFCPYNIRKTSQALKKIVALEMLESYNRIKFSFLNVAFVTRTVYLTGQILMKKVDSHEKKLCINARLFYDVRSKLILMKKVRHKCKTFYDVRSKLILMKKFMHKCKTFFMTSVHS